MHVLDRQGDTLVIPALGKPIESVKSFASGEPLDWDVTEFGTLLRLPDDVDGPDKVAEITVGGE